jgi:hypothetical protein
VIAGTYTVTVLPDGTAADSMANPIYMPPPPQGSNLVRVVLVQHIYLTEPKFKDRFGGVDSPIIEPFLVSNPSNPASCPSGDFTAIINQFGDLEANFSQSPLPRNGKIEFYRPPASDVPFADGSSPLTKHDCTGYLMATVYPDELAVIHLPTVPAFFDNTHITKKTTFVEPDGVRYLSMGSYGASPLSAADNENVAGPDIKRQDDGSAMFIAIPIRLDPDLSQRVKEKAESLGYNVMPLGEYGPLIPLFEEGPQINPFLTYRNKVATFGFAGDIQNVACFKGSDFSHAPSPVYAASPKNMGQYAPVGIECLVSDFLYAGCGQDFGHWRP